MLTRFVFATALLRRHLRFRNAVLALLISALVPAGRAQGGPVSGMALWLEANQGVTTNGSGYVTSWADQSGNVHNATASNGPLLVSNGVNGQPALQFNGQNQFLSISGQVITSQQFTIMAVVTDTSSSTGFREIFSNWNTSNEDTSVFLGDTAQNPVRARFTDDIGGAAQGQTGVGTIANPTSPFILTGDSGSTDASVYQDSTQLYDLGHALSSRNLTTPYVIGQQGSANGEWWSGDIAEILVYNFALSSAQLQQNWDYLDAKYLPSAVPEPSTLALLATAAIVLGAQRCRRAAGVAVV